MCVLMSLKPIKQKPEQVGTAVAFELVVRVTQFGQLERELLRLPNQASFRVLGVNPYPRAIDNSTWYAYYSAISRNVPQHN